MISASDKEGMTASNKVRTDVSDGEGTDCSNEEGTDPSGKELRHRRVGLRGTDSSDGEDLLQIDVSWAD